MSSTFEDVKELVRRGLVRISAHGYDELAADRIRARDAIDGIDSAVAVEDYPSYPKGPCVLVLQTDADGRPIHVLWGIPAGNSSPAVLITAYRPQADRWNDDFTRRRI